MDLNDEIAKVAHELWDKRGRGHGKDREDWYEAELIVRARHDEAREKAGKAAEKLAITEKEPSKKSPGKSDKGVTKAQLRKAKPADALKK